MVDSIDDTITQQGIVLAPIILPIHDPDDGWPELQGCLASTTEVNLAFNALGHSISSKSLSGMYES